MSSAARIAALCVSTIGPWLSTFFNAWSTYPATSRVYSGGRSERTVYSSPPIITLTACFLALTSHPQRGGRRLHRRRHWPAPRGRSDGRATLPPGPAPPRPASATLCFRTRAPPPGCAFPDRGATPPPPPPPPPGRPPPARPRPLWGAPPRPPP